MIPYGKQTLDENDKKSVLEILEKNTYLTTGPTVSEFEKKYVNMLVVIME